MDTKELIGEVDRVAAALSDVVRDLRELSWDLLTSAELLDMAWRLRAVKGELAWALGRLERLVPSPPPDGDREAAHA